MTVYLRPPRRFSVGVDQKAEKHTGHRTLGSSRSEASQ